MTIKVWNLIKNNIGPFNTKLISNELGISKNTLETNLSPDKAEKLSKLLISLKKEKTEKSNINRLIKVGSYRGSRHRLGYPVRGQRTRSNAKTAWKLNINKHK